MFENCTDWFADRAAISAPAAVEWEHEDKKVLVFYTQVELAESRNNFVSHRRVQVTTMEIAIGKGIGIENKIGIRIGIGIEFLHCCQSHGHIRTAADLIRSSGPT